MLLLLNISFLQLQKEDLKIQLEKANNMGNAHSDLEAASRGLEATGFSESNAHHQDPRPEDDEQPAPPSGSSRVVTPPSSSRKSWPSGTRWSEYTPVNSSALASSEISLRSPYDRNIYHNILATRAERRAYRAQHRANREPTFSAYVRNAYDRAAAQVPAAEEENAPSLPSTPPWATPRIPSDSPQYESPTWGPADNEDQTQQVDDEEEDDDDPCREIRLARDHFRDEVYRVMDELDDERGRHDDTQIILTRTAHAADFAEAEVDRLRLEVQRLRDVIVFLDWSSDEEGSSTRPSPARSRSTPKTGSSSISSFRRRRRSNSSPPSRHSSQHSSRPRSVRRRLRLASTDSDQFREGSSSGHRTPAITSSASRGTSRNSTSTPIPGGRRPVPQLVAVEPSPPPAELLASFPPRHMITRSQVVAGRSPPRALWSPQRSSASGSSGGGMRATARPAGVGKSKQGKRNGGRK